ncbi:hypothetical protein AB0N65_03850 [Paenarthrobacter sp. NPDC089322]|uniref:DUF6993 domain-containing protein n=1 Tax=Paenarthrobacter sp. NPDC089322 TaxID=3155065 RepID=UPI0034142857
MSGGTTVEQAKQSSASGRRRDVVRKFAATCCGAALAAALAACTGTSPQTVVEAPRPSQAPGAEQVTDPALAATSTAVEAALKKLAAANPKPEREALRAALAAAGIPEANVEVSVSRTPTGLDVDALEAAALTGEQCVFGQIRDGGVVVSILPVLSTGKCFIGDVR